MSNAATAVGSSASWFKINEMGLVSSNPDYWATEVLNDNCGRYDVKIPTGIAPGQYLLRAEVIALHVASSVGGAQYVKHFMQIFIRPLMHFFFRQVLHVLLPTKRRWKRHCQPRRSQNSRRIQCH